MTKSFLDQIAYSTFFINLVYSEKATKFCEISTLLLSTVHTNKSKVEISQNFAAFSEYMNFDKRNCFRSIPNNFVILEVQNFCFLG